MQKFLALLFETNSSKGEDRDQDKDIVQLRKRFEEQIQKGIYLQGKEPYHIQLTKSEANHVRDMMAKAYSRYGAIVMLERGVSSESIFSGGHGLQAIWKRTSICRGLEIYRDEAAATMVRVHNEEEKDLIRHRARAKGYTFSMTIALMFLTLFALFNVPEVNADQVESHHLHALAMPRHKAVGMWLPDQHHLLKIRQHRNSVVQPRKDINKLLKPFYQPTGEVLARQRWANEQLKGPLWTPEQLDQARDESIHLERRQMDDSEDQREEGEEEEWNEYEKRIPAKVIGIAIKAAGYVVTSLITLGCTLYNQSTKATKTGKVLCIVLGALVSILSILGGHFAGNKFVESSGQRATEIVMDDISNVAQTVANVGKRDGQLWHEPHSEWFKETYQKSLWHDQQSIRKGTAHYDKHTGQMLTAWDMIMSYIHPIQHSFSEGYNTTIWHEKTDLGHRKHTYTPMQNQLHKRQCAESDTEQGESQPYDYCEQGSYAGYDGVYNGYDYTGNGDEAEAMHLRLGNDSYAQEVSQLEGDLVYLGGVNAVCENVTDSGRQIYIGLREFERNGDTYAGYDGCHDVV